MNKVASSPALLLWIAAALLFGAPGKLEAGFKLIPIQAEFRPAGTEAVQSFRLENPDAEPVAVESSISQRAMDENGNDLLTPDEESFVIVPQQIILRPQQVQAIRVQYVGKADLTGEAAFRMVAEQIPLDSQAQDSGGKLRLLVRYMASLYVVPAGARSDLAVESVERAAAADGSPRLAVILANRGNAHQILSEPILAIKAGSGAAVEIKPAELSGQNFLAGVRRRFLIAVPAALGEGPLAAEVRLP
jgi:fimbrial chaperone protein